MQIPLAIVDAVERVLLALWKVSSMARLKVGPVTLGGPEVPRSWPGMFGGGVGGRRGRGRGQGDRPVRGEVGDRRGRGRGQGDRPGSGEVGAGQGERLFW